MSFIEAVKTVVFKKYATFSGRASRSEFWWFTLAFFGIDISFEIGAAFFVSSQIGGLLASIAIIGFNLGLLIPFLAVMVRRLHDRNMVGWWALIWVFVQLLAVFELLFPQFSDMIDIVFGVTGLFILALLITLAFKGTQGTNRYGLNPFASKMHEDVFA